MLLKIAAEQPNTAIIRANLFKTLSLLLIDI